MRDRKHGAFEVDNQPADRLRKFLTAASVCVRHYVPTLAEAAAYEFVGRDGPGRSRHPEEADQCTICPLDLSSVSVLVPGSGLTTILPLPGTCPYTPGTIFSILAKVASPQSIYASPAKTMEKQVAY